MASSDEQSYEKIVFAGEMTRAESDAAFKWHSATLLRRGWPRWPERIITVVAAILILLAITFATVLFVSEQAGIPVMWTAILATAAGFWLNGLLHRRVLKRIRQLNVAGIGPCTFAFDPGGLSVELASGSSSRTPWRTIKRIDLTPRHLAFWHDDYFAQYLPRAVIGSGETELFAAIHRWAPHLVPPNTRTVTKPR
jgi:hypothetical protein